MCRTDWPKLLQEIIYIHNAQINASTGFTPNEVMFGTRMRTKVDAALPLAETKNVTNPMEYCETARERNNLMYERVAGNTDMPRDKMKNYDHGSKVSDISHGDWALVKGEARTYSLSSMYRGKCLNATESTYTSKSRD